MEKIPLSQKIEENMQSNSIDYEKVSYWDKPLSEISESVQPKSADDVWGTTYDTDPVKKIEKNFPDPTQKKPEKRNNTELQIERRSLFGVSGNESLVKTNEDAEKIAAIKNLARREQEDKERRKGIYAQLKKIFGAQNP